MADSQPQHNRIKIANPPLEDNNRTYLTSDTSATDTSLPVLSTSGDQFKITGDVDYYVMAGDYGEEKSEIKLVDAGSGTTATNFNVAALTHAHSVSDPVTYIPYNQIKIYGATSSGGAKTLITGGTIDIDTSEQFTEFIYTGDTYSYFYTVYYNSTTEVLSAYSDEITSSTFSHNSAKRIIKSGLRKALTQIDENQDGVLTWDVAIETLQDGIDEIITRKRKWSFLHKIDSSLSTTADQAYITMPTDALQIDFVSVDNLKLNWMSKRDYDKHTYSGATTTSGNPQSFTIRNNQIFLIPTPSEVFDVVLEYHKNPAVLDSLTDVIDQPFVVMLIYYCASTFAYTRGNDKRGALMMAKFYTLLEQQVEEYTGPLQTGSAEYVEYTNYENDAELSSFGGTYNV